jgi:ribosomal protein S18 acetylase RimI-like enzyme
MTPFPIDGDEWTTRAVRAEDRSAIERLWTETFGDPDKQATRWVELALGDAPAACWVATADDELVGFVVAAAGDRQFAREALDGDDLAESLPEPVATIQMVAIDPAWGSSGVGTALVQRCFDWAHDRASTMFVVLWQREDHIDATPLAEKFGLEHARTLPNYYSDRANCPDCEGTCTCAAAVHVRSLDDERRLDANVTADGAN